MEQNFDQLMRKYKDELMRYASSQTTAARTENTESWPATGMNTPNMAMRQNSTNANQTQGGLPVLPMDNEKGYLIVQVSALQGAVPIIKADVVVTRDIGNETYLMWYDTTDESGKSRKFVLPAPPREMSEHPSNGVPYAVYNIRVSAPGFYTITNADAQVFSGETSIAAVDMIPLRESQNRTEENITYNTPPSELLNS